MSHDEFQFSKNASVLASPGVRLDLRSDRTFAGARSATADENPGCRSRGGRSWSARSPVRSSGGEGSGVGGRNMVARQPDGFRDGGVPVEPRWKPAPLRPGVGFLADGPFWPTWNADRRCGGWVSRGEGQCRGRKTPRCPARIAPTCSRAPRPTSSGDRSGAPRAGKAPIRCRAKSLRSRLGSRTRGLARVAPREARLRGRSLSAGYV
jgi:hypothetical protein